MFCLVIVRRQMGTVRWPGMDGRDMLPVWLYLQGLQCLVLAVPLSLWISDIRGASERACRDEMQRVWMLMSSEERLFGRESELCVANFGILCK